MSTRGYEALIIMKSAGTEQDLARHAAQLEEHVKKVGGRLEHSQNLGRRRLAFRISRQAEGYYHLVRFEVLPARVVELERLFRLNDTVLRFIILTADEVGPLIATAPRSASTSTNAVSSAAVSSSAREAS